MTSSDSTPGRRALLLLVLGLYAVLTLPKLLTLGLFQDGVVFASVARNMAEGLGGFWTPRFTDTAYRLEFMHPPLGPWLLSHFFSWFGDRPRLEVFYGIGVGLVNLGLLVLLWKTVTRHLGTSCGAWLALLAYVAMPLTSHSYTSNLLEGPMTGFVLVAAIAGHRAVEARTAPALVGLSAASGVAIFLAVQTKGPAGAFVLVYPFLFTLLSPGFRVRRGSAVSAIALAAALVATAAFILPNASAVEFTRQHYQGLVFQALEGGNIPAQGRTSVLETLVGQTLAPLILLLIGAWATRARPRPDGARRDLIFLLTALAGTLPYLVTTHQYARYALPALPMVAMALAFSFQGLGGHLEAALSSRGRKRVAAAAGLLLALGVVGALAGAGTVRKHGEFHRDFSLQALELEGRPLFSVCPEELAVDWELVGDAQRYLSASLTPETGHDYWLTEADSGCAPPEGCRHFHPPSGGRYRLYRCR